MKNKNEIQVYCVIEEDRGYGSCVLAVFLDEAKAKTHAALSKHYYIEIVPFISWRIIA